MTSKTNNELFAIKTVHTDMQVNAEEKSGMATMKLATTVNKKICSESTNLRRSGGSGFQTLDSRIRSMIRISAKIVSIGP